MNKKELQKHFEEKYLKGTCFDSLEELLKDETSVMINAPRALIAVNLCGVWRGLQDKEVHFEKKENNNKLVRKLKKKVERLMGTYEDMTREAAEDIVLSDFRHYKQYAQLEKMVKE